MDRVAVPALCRDVSGFLRACRELLEGRCCVQCACSLQEVEAVADRVLLVDGGRLVFDGSPDELKRNGSIEESFYSLTDYGMPGKPAGQGGPTS